MRKLHKKKRHHAVDLTAEGLMSERSRERVWMPIAGIALAVVFAAIFAIWMIWHPKSKTAAPVAAAPELSLVRTYAGADGFAALIKDFANGAHAFGVDDFRDSYSPAQWTQLRPKLDAAGFRGVRVFLKVDLSDEMKRYLGASTAHAEVPSEILE